MGEESFFKMFDYMYILFIMIVQYQTYISLIQKHLLRTDFSVIENRFLFVNG